MNDLAKPDLKPGVPLSCIPEVGHRRPMQRKLKFQSTAVCAVVIMIATCRGLALDPSQPASSYLRKNFTIEDGLPANEVHAILQTQNGLLWLGLARIPSAALDHFDRALVTMYHVGVSQSDQILCIHRSRAGTLWVGSGGGLYRFDRSNFSSIIPHDLISRIEESLDGPNAPFHAEPARAASRIVSWPAMCRAKTIQLEKVRW